MTSSDQTREERLAEIRDLNVDSCSADAPYNPDVWALEHARVDLLAEVDRLQTQVARLAGRYDAQTDRADQSANRTRGLMRYAIRRVGELGQLRDAVHDEGDAQRADKLAFAMQEIRDVFKRDHVEEDGPFDEVDRLKTQLSEALATIDRVARIRPVEHGCDDGSVSLFVYADHLRAALGFTSDGTGVTP